MHLFEVDSSLEPWINKFRDQGYNVVLDDSIEQATWEIENGNPVILLHPLELSAAIKNLSKDELKTFLYDPFLGVLVHEQEEALLALEISKAGITKEMRIKYPKFNFDRPSVQRCVVGSFDSIGGLAHDILISNNPTAYYNYIITVGKKIGWGN